ncbi:MAG: GntR family transcriptional regulator [bacterium]|nr:GntR family transcriptional regulator [bacterium]MDT8367385.1 GntR family transcriptional regulator [bacterium]
MQLKIHQTLREQIVSSLRDSIIKGELNPGQKLTEPELAKKLGISRTPIREAFRQLESEGFLTVIPRRGAVVSRITRKDIGDFYDLKSLLEGYAARIAAEKITEKEIEKLRKINEQLAVLAEKDDVDGFFFKNEEFHNTFISYCGNEKLLEFHKHLVQRFMRFRLGALSVPGRLLASVKQHRNIIKALEEKDGPLAETVVLEHALLSGVELAERVEQDGEEKSQL